MSRSSPAPAIQLEPVLLARDEAAAFLAMARSSFEAGVQAGRIPKPRKVSPGRVAWLVSELRAHAASLPVSDLPPPVNCEQGRPRKGHDLADATS